MSTHFEIMGNDEGHKVTKKRILSLEESAPSILQAEDVVCGSKCASKRLCSPQH